MGCGPYGDLIQYEFAHREKTVCIEVDEEEKERKRERGTICGFYLTCDALGIQHDFCGRTVILLSVPVYVLVWLQN